MIFVGCFDGNLVIEYLDAQSIPKWNVLKPTYYNHTFGLSNSFFKDNGCIVFIQGANAN
jgi:hypothetical protein